ncbi:hypothetical protein ABEB36_015233 [Hypothenemus hampei]|uniref:DUF4817 domain-containing protein n=1 Tax=Hypothenemus hampei TaxID=57062 RepID=A0ABD1E2U9_HYPHA
MCTKTVDMILIYGECPQNAAAVSRVYSERFPLRAHLRPAAFVRLIQRARDTGELRENRGRHADRGRPPQMLEVEEEIINLIEDDLTTSTREIARQVGVSQTKVWSTLQQEQLHPYHVQRVQALLPQDHPQRVQFCLWLLQQHAHDEHFTRHVLVTDEATFTRNGVNNFRNTHVWSMENPHAVRRTTFQQRFSFNVWSGMINGMLIGPFFLPDRMTGANYLNFLQNNLPVLLEDVTLNIRQIMWFLHDGAPSHFSCPVRDELNRQFPHRWVGRNGPILWPPRSPDLTPCDFFLWGYMKSLVYTTEINTLEELRNRIPNACETIRGHQDFILKTCTESWIRRATLCAHQTNGDNFEQFL